MGLTPAAAARHRSSAPSTHAPPPPPHKTAGSLPEDGPCAGGCDACDRAAAGGPAAAARDITKEARQLLAGMEALKVRMGGKSWRRGARGLNRPRACGSKGSRAASNSAAPFAPPPRPPQNYGLSRVVQVLRGSKSKVRARATPATWPPPSAALPPLPHPAPSCLDPPYMSQTQTRPHPIPAGHCPLDDAEARPRRRAPPRQRHCPQRGLVEGPRGAAGGQGHGGAEEHAGEGGPGRTGSVLS
jgi:hypothetical protein